MFDVEISFEIITLKLKLFGILTRNRKSKQKQKANKSKNYKQHKVLVLLAT